MENILYSELYEPVVLEVTSGASEKSPKSSSSVNHRIVADDDGESAAFRL
jgi:hypothetical protein